MNNFIKLNSSLFDRPRFSRCPRNSKRKGKLLNTIVDFENVVFLKEREGDILGDGKFSGFPKFEMMASLENFEMMASRRKIETPGIPKRKGRFHYVI